MRETDEGTRRDRTHDRVDLRESAAVGRVAFGLAYAKFFVSFRLSSSPRFYGHVSLIPRFTLRLASRSDVRFAIQHGSRAYEKRTKSLAACLFDAYADTLL